MLFRALKNKIDSWRGGVRPSAEQLQDLEDTLIESDINPRIAATIITEVKQSVKHADEVMPFLTSHLTKHLEKLVPAKDPMFFDCPEVWLVCGVNGAGKTTTIGKMAFLLQKNKRVALAAADTFRAAAQEQLSTWADQSQTTLYSIADAAPSTVAFSATQSFIANQDDILLIDTAGRLHSQDHLIDELKKVKKVSIKALNDNVEKVAIKTLLVLDGHTGQNMLAQIEVFQKALEIDGIIITKLDGIARGGAIVSLAFNDAPPPIYFIGNGEGIHDLLPFTPAAFVNNIL